MILNIKRLCGSGKGSNKQINITCKEVFSLKTHVIKMKIFHWSMFYFDELGPASMSIELSIAT